MKTQNKFGNLDIKNVTMLIKRQKLVFANSFYSSTDLVYQLLVYTRWLSNFTFFHFFKMRINSVINARQSQLTSRLFQFSIILHSQLCSSALTRLSYPECKLRAISFNTLYFIGEFLATSWVNDFLEIVIQSTVSFYKIWNEMDSNPTHILCSIKV